jgi:hypothetical protein
MFYCYLDESGIHAGAEICLIAGYFGGLGQWRKLNKLWEEVLRDRNVPLSEFHAQNLVKRTNFFHHWSAPESYDLQRALAEAIAQFKVYPLAQGILVRDFFKLSHIERRFMTGATLTPEGRIKETGSPERPYFVPFQQVVRRVLSHAPVGGKAHFFCGVDRPFAKYATDLYSKLKNTGVHPYQDRFGNISYPLAKETPALQAADLLVHILYLDMKRRAEAGSLRALPKPSALIRTLIANARHKDDLVYQDERLMRETMELIPIEQRGDLLKEGFASD